MIATTSPNQLCSVSCFIYSCSVRTPLAFQNAAADISSLLVNAGSPGPLPEPASAPALPAPALPAPALMTPAPVPAPADCVVLASVGGLDSATADGPAPTSASLLHARWPSTYLHTTCRHSDESPDAGQTQNIHARTWLGHSGRHPAARYQQICQTQVTHARRRYQAPVLDGEMQLQWLRPGSIQ